MVQNKKTQQKQRARVSALWSKTKKHSKKNALGLVHYGPKQKKTQQKQRARVSALWSKSEKNTAKTTHSGLCTMVQNKKTQQIQLSDDLLSHERGSE